MKKNRKKTLILDLDGTLYYHHQVQFIMGCWLLLYYTIHIWRLKELLILLDYRRYREQNRKHIIENQYIIVAKKHNVSAEKVEKLIEKWILKKPLKVIRIFKDKKLLNMIKDFKKRGGNIIIYSDYPTNDKLNILKVPYDKSYSSTHPKINTLKPNTKGLQYIIRENKLKKEETLFVGDRDSKDGECARKCHIDYVIIPKYFRKHKLLIIKQKIGVD